MQIANIPGNLIAEGKSNFLARHQLIEENIRLKANLTLLTAKLHNLLQRDKENELLRELFSSSSKLQGSFVTAELLSIPNSSNYQDLIVGRGRSAHVYIGQPVLDAKGVVGHITAVGKNSSKVTLLTDNSVAIPVETREGFRSIAVGLGVKGLLRLANVQDTANFKVGQMIYTSGLGLIYPEGYPVGQVVEVKQKQGEGLLSVYIRPMADIYRLRLMLLYWPENSKSNSHLSK